MKYKYFVARDKFAAKNGLGYLYLYEEKPERGDDCWLDNEEFGRALELDPTLFQEIKWEDEPIEVEITIKRAIKITMKDEATAVPYGETGLNFVYYKNPMSATVVESSKKDITGAIIPSQVMYKGVVYDVTSISWSAFRGCESLTSIEIPNSVTTIGNGAFYKCTSLTSINIPNSVTTIGKEAFAYCTSLTSIEIPNSVTKIGESAFFFCTSLTSIEIPESVTSIGVFAFVYCESLASIEIPESVTYIGEWAFRGCFNLKTARVPVGCEIANYAFPPTCKIEWY